MLENVMCDEPDDKAARDYEDSVIEQHKNSPPLNGERLAVYSWAPYPELLGYGTRIESWWSNFYYQHMSKVRLDNGQELTTLMERQVRQIEPEEIRKTFRSV